MHDLVKVVRELHCLIVDFLIPLIFLMRLRYLSHLLIAFTLVLLTRSTMRHLC